MLRKIKKYIQQNNLIDPGDKIIIAVSGGPDSMALLSVLHDLQTDLQITIAAAHLNHDLRKEADDEEEFVKQNCERMGIPFYSRKLPIRKLAAAENHSLEETGRKYRYQFFREIKAHTSANKIATAHHGDDMAESVLLHLLRGSGIKGLRGIMPLNNDLIRPLLCTDKNEIMEYLVLAGLPFCIDRSNYNTAFLRNKIRNELIPYLQKEYNPRIMENLNQLACIARHENSFLEQSVERIWPEIVSAEGPGRISIQLPSFIKLHPALQHRLILAILTRLRGETGWGMVDVQKTLNLMEKSGSSKVIKLKKGVIARKIYEQIEFSLGKIDPKPYEYLAVIPGKVNIAETGEVYSLTVADSSEYRFTAGETFLDYDKVTLPVFIRSRRAGDRIFPPGIEGSKKIKDYFIDIKLPLPQRDRVPLLASESEVYAVLGHLVSRTVAVSPSSRRILVIKTEG